MARPTLPGIGPAYPNASNPNGERVQPHLGRLNAQPPPAADVRIEFDQRGHWQPPQLEVVGGGEGCRAAGAVADEHHAVAVFGGAFRHLHPLRALRFVPAEDPRVLHDIGSFEVGEERPDA